MRYGLLAIALLACSAAARASLPPIPLPAWIRVDLAMARAPEIGRAAPVTLALEALVGKLPGARWKLELPEQLELASGAASGSVDLEPGKPVVIRAEVTAKAPLEGANLAVEVTTSPPRAALADQVERTTRGDAQKREAGLRLVAALPREDVQRRIVGFTVSADEGLLAEATDPAYRRVVKSADGKAQLLLLDAVPGVDARGIEAQLRVVGPKLATFRRIASGKADDPLGRLVADLTLENAKLAYQRALLMLVAGRAADARAALAVQTPGVPAALESARRAALAAALALSGDTAGALRELDALEKRVTGPALRYVHYDRAEVQRLAGHLTAARAAYEAALAAGPSLTAARRRLSDL